MKTPLAATATLMSLVGSTVLLAPTVACAAAPQLPSKAAPHGMREITTSGTGRILTTHLGGTSSARKMLSALKILSGDYFDTPFTITRAYVDQNDQRLQAAFTAKLKGVPVHGVAAVALMGDGGEGILLFDNAKTFTKSFRILTARQTGGNGNKRKVAPAAPLTRQTAPDGSCQISLPPGYRITGAFKGTLDIVGPHGEQMGLGAPILCTSYEGGRLFPGIPPVDFNDPVRALLDYLQYSARKAGRSLQIKVLDARPVPGWQTGRAAFVRYTGFINGKQEEAFGLFSIAQTDANQALLYMSFIDAPNSTYRQQFPDMLRAWGSWSINPSVFTERLMAAAQSMRGMNDIILSSHANQEQTNARVNEAWSDVFRDQGTWQNPDTGSRYKLPTSYTNLGTPTQGGVALQAVPLGDL